MKIISKSKLMTLIVFVILAGVGSLLGWYNQGHIDEWYHWIPFGLLLGGFIWLGARVNGLFYFKFEKKWL